jgi:GAF domain-containing protein
VDSQESLAEVFAHFADTQAGAFDPADFLQQLCDRSVELLGVDGAGLLLADPAGRLRVVASTGEAVRRLEQLQVRTGEGPGVDCHRGGRVVGVADVATAAGRWPVLAPACVRAGFGAVHAIPMSRDDRTIGVIDLYTVTGLPLAPGIVRILRALTDVVTIGLLNRRTQDDQHVLIEQLQLALSSRVVIEQAKGILAERGGVSPDAAFAALRQQARTHNVGLTGLARDIVDGTVQRPPPDQPSGGKPGL